MPFGFPVVPEVYRMNSGCSASNGLGACARSDCRSTTSCHQTSRPSVHGDVLAGAPDDEHVLDAAGSPATASSTAGLSAARRAAAVAAVGGDDELGVGVVDPAAQRVGGEAAEDHRCAARRCRAQASIATTASGIIGR